MKKLLLLLIVLFFIQCGNKGYDLINRDNVAGVNKHTTVEELEKLFSNDSIVRIPEEENYVNEYAVYSKDGKHLISVFPQFPKDSLKLIERVKIFSPEFKTEKGISTASTFHDIKSNYSIQKIDPTFTTALLYIDELNGTIALDKKDLGLDELNMNKISKDQIPDQAGIKYMTIWFN